MLKTLAALTQPARFMLLGMVAFLLAACDTMPMAGNGPAVDPNEPVAVAIMVPRGSGEAANDDLANALVNAARLAQADLGGSMIDLRVYHTAVDPTQAAAEATRAIAEGAQIIVGPLYSTVTPAVATVAAQSNIKVLSFSNNPAIAGGNIFILGTTFEDVATRLYGYSVNQGKANVGVVYQAGLEGEAGKTAAENAARSVGANLAAMASYPLNIEGLSEAAPTVAETMKSNAVQSILFTDTPTRGLPFIMAAIGSDGVTPDNTQFMGLTRWDASTELLQQPSAQGAVFAVPDPVLSAQFDARYLAAYGSEPHNLAPLAYDAVAAVGALIKSAQSEAATDTFSVERLTNPAGFVGVNGIFRFLPNGLNQRGLAVLEVEDGSAIVVESAPRNFGGVGF